MKIYISGPMTGKPNLNRFEFEKAEKRLISAGWEVVNPAKLKQKPGADWQDCMRLDLRHLVEECDSIYMLEGWNESRGAIVEHYLATMLGFLILFQEGRPPEFKVDAGKLELEFHG